MQSEFSHPCFDDFPPAVSHVEGEDLIVEKRVDVNDVAVFQGVEIPVPDIIKDRNHIPDIGRDLEGLVVAVGDFEIRMVITDLVVPGVFSFVDIADGFIGEKGIRVEVRLVLVSHLVKLIGQTCGVGHHHAVVNTFTLEGHFFQLRIDVSSVERAEIDNEAQFFTRREIIMYPVVPKG